MNDENRCMTDEFRVCFPNVFQPKETESGELRYQVVALFEDGEKTPCLKTMKKMARQAVTEKWGDTPPKNLRSPFRDGAEKSDQYPEFDGCVFVNLTSKFKPGIVDENVEDIIDQSEFYAGCYARATVRAYAYDQKGNKGVAFGLFNLQKLGDGDALGGSVSAHDDFGDKPSEKTRGTTGRGKTQPTTGRAKTQEMPDGFDDDIPF